MLPIMFQEACRIPTDIVDLESFRRWARSDDFPERGWISYLRGEIWLDLSMEQLFTHNGVKTAIVHTVRTLARAARLGYVFSDRARLTNLDVDLSTEADGVFVSYDAVRDLRVPFTEGSEGGHVEIVGSPDIVLEVVSRTSVRKDTKVLRQLYWEAGVPEYWLVDARKEEPRFDILRRGRRAYTAARSQDGWLKSVVLGHSFRLLHQLDPLGLPEYTLEMQA